MHSLRFAILLAALAWGVAPASRAADRFWTNTTSSADFTNNTSVWNGPVPTSADNANFTNNNNYTAVFSASTNTLNALFNATQSGVVTQDIGAGRTWSVSNNVQISSSTVATNTVVLISGSLLTSNLVIGSGSTAAGTLTLSGGSLTLSGGGAGAGGGNLIVGTNGARGTLVIAGGSLLVTNVDAAQPATRGLLVGQGPNGNGAIIMTGGTVSNLTSLVLANAPAPPANSASGTFLMTGGTWYNGGNATSIVGRIGFGTLTVSGGLMTFNDTLSLSGNGTGTVWVTSGATLAVSNSLFIGFARRGQFTVSNATVRALALGVGSGSSVLIADGGQVSSTNLIVGSRNMGANGVGSTVTVAGASSTWTVTGGSTDIGGSATGGARLNQLILTNGAQFISVGGAVGLGLLNITDDNNSILVTDGSKLVVDGNNTAINLRVGNVGDTNTLIISRGSTVIVSNNTSAGMLVGVNPLNTGGGKKNSVLLTDNSLLQVNGTLHVGFNPGGAGGGSQNSILVSNAAILEANNIETHFASASGNTISNVGGVYQFTTASPGITNGFAGSISLTNGVVSFRNVNNVDVYNNWAGAGHNLTNITYRGENTFRLNSSSNTTAGQTYTFATGLGATNYTRLELMNGATAYRGGNLTVGNGGALFVSNTTATIFGLVSNQAGGLVSFLNANATFQSNVVNNGGWITDPTTNTFLGNYTVGNSGTIVMGTDDLFVFKSNFFNQSTQSNTYDTLAGKFLFNGTGLTQQFTTAGKDLGPGGIYPTPPGQTSDLNGAFAPNNFALGTLEIANASTVMVSDSFALDGQRAALYLDSLFMGLNSLLIVSNNVSVYYANSNAWSYANNVVLLGDAEIHLLVPEPSVLFLAMSSLVTLHYVRRRSRQHPGAQP